MEGGLFGVALMLSTRDNSFNLSSFDGGLLARCRCGLSVLALAAMVPSGGAEAIEVIEESQGIPDFSYAGYHRSERAIPRVEGPIFNIEDFGAIPDDGRSDRAAIQRAIDAAGKNGGGVVLVPKGRFDLGQTSDAGSVFIRSGNIVLRGEGRGRSILHMSEALAPPPPMRLWASPYVIQVLAPEKSRIVGEIVKDVKQGDFEVWLTEVDGLKSGDWIALKLQDTTSALLESELAGFQVIDSRWLSLIKDGVQVSERHEIESVTGKRVRLCTPVIKPIDVRYQWRVEQFFPLREVGFEGLRFEGAWQERFKHHRSWMDDGGYSMLALNGVVNSWIRDCSFVDVNCAGMVSNSAQVTVIDSVIDGTPGHSAIRFAASTNCLMARVEDRAGQWHSVGVSSQAIGNVFWRCYWGSNTSFESHAGQPRHTLFDSCVGGIMMAHGGGALGSLPNHLEGLMLWNHLKTNEALTDFQFEPLDRSHWRILQPSIVGMHGTPIDFREGQSSVISLGQPVAEGSLYEFQVKRRLGELPEDLRD